LISLDIYDIIYLKYLINLVSDLSRSTRMIITISGFESPTAVSVLHLDGKLDGANYEILIDEAQNIYDTGTRDLILDLSKLTYISSAGLAAIHQVALMFRGERHPGWDGGWDAYHSIDRDRSRGTQQHVKLIAPPEPVQQVFDLTGFASLFDVFTDSQQALVSFRKVVPSIQTSLP
jgi:anti-sigma B factor antagonist